MTPVRLHLAVLAGLFLLCVAFGYQLDKQELVYSQAGVATGVSYTDFNAQFLAFDVLTVLSGLAAAFLVGAAFTRWIWPLGLMIGVWLVGVHRHRRLYPEAIQRFTVDPNTYAQEQQYIANNIEMTRLAYDLDAWEARSYRAISRSPRTHPQRGRHVHQRPAVGLPPAADHAGPAPDRPPVLRLHGRGHGPLHDRRQAAPGHALRPRAGHRAEPDRHRWVNERIIYTHGIGVAMIPVNEVTNEGQPQLLVRNLPPVSTSGAPDIAEPRIYFGESDNHYVVTGAAQAEFDYPRGAGEGSGDETTSWTGTTGIPLDTTLNRLLFALRFKDLDLLISDQIRADSQLLFHRTLSDRLGRIAPFLRYDKDPYVVIDGAGHLVYVQDAYTVSNQFPNARASTRVRWAGVRPGRRGHQLHPEQRQDHDERL